MEDRVKLFCLFVLLFLTSMLYSCDCNQIVEGIVLDKDTKQPVDSVYIQNIQKHYDKSFTNEKGHFVIRSISGGIGGCPTMKLELTKGSYETKTLEIESGKRDTIYLLKLHDH